MPSKTSRSEAEVSDKETEQANKNSKDRLVDRLDNYQQRHAWISFPYSMQKKYGEDEAGYQAALVTYYGFLSLFPLLVVALSIAQLSILHDANLKSRIITSLNTNFPIVGEQLKNNVHATQKAGTALFISIVLTLYGARGIAQAFQNVMNHIWQVPKFRRGGFKNNLKSVALVVIMGIGFLISGALSSYLTSPRHNFWLRIAAAVISLAVLFGIIIVVFKLSLSVRRSFKDFIAGSIFAAVGFQIIQIAGGFLITHELNKLSSLYGTFALILAILFWIYLLTRIILYGTEIDTVRSLRLWPRSLTNNRLTPADQRALKMYAGRERYIAPPDEELAVKFK